MEWIDMKAMMPPSNELVLVNQQLTGRCLRYRMDTGDAEPDWFDENEEFDDSGLEITHWAKIPDAP